MTIQQRKSYLIQVGAFLSQFKSSGIEKRLDLACNDPFFDQMLEQIDMAVHYNGWFTRENVLFSLEEWDKALSEENLEKWLKSYNFQEESKTVGLVMAGNVPLVGFHDFISVLLSGHKVLVKLSSNDKKLLPILANYLVSINPEFSDKIEFTDGRMNNFDAIIATGSNNTARYFEYYFRNKPSIIRKNRNSVAILTGNETQEELKLLAEDIFRYFGLGCRNVSKLYVPQDYNFDSFFNAVLPWAHLMDHAKYANNYDYNKAVYLMSEFKLLDNGFLILKEDPGFGSPIATLFYERYTNKDALLETLQAERENLQCVVSQDLMESEVSYGATQHPKLWEYADNVDTLTFLQNL
ncbi:acyl-CoA reductase [Gillisia limnaea]|uniref:Acyl-CoA reductase n=1 Tax=Gillisia limnaea (strain DSM 15749 / LMG 21470 / R-8282) TaxID=865937 RepID=H2BZU8_GILLR|nr:acyl-CoA reductase [Gillisia limnaea]EHQ01290.1 acyl-CoA reductase [Gillisia limnaea DSM 15749]